MIKPVNMLAATIRPRWPLRIGGIGMVIESIRRTVESVLST
jgi:hypothetical protein